MDTIRDYYSQMTEEVTEAAKEMSTNELRENIHYCSNLLKTPLDKPERIQVEKECAIYQKALDRKLNIFPGSGTGIQKPN